LGAKGEGVNEGDGKSEGENKPLHAIFYITGICPFTGE